MSETRHASLVATRVNGEWRGALIEGPSGSGKSDLALRCLEAGFTLVSDDRTIIFAHDGAVFGRAPDALDGLIEVRGVGMRRVTPLPLARIAIAIDLVAEAVEVERMPEPATRNLANVKAPLYRLWPFEETAPAKLAALLHCGDGSPP